jgi:hypothetical protein
VGIKNNNNNNNKIKIKKNIWPSMLSFERCIGGREI